MPAPPYTGPIDKKIACHMEWDPDCKLWVGNLGEEGNRYGNSYIFFIKYITKTLPLTPGVMHGAAPAWGGPP